MVEFYRVEGSLAAFSTFGSLLIILTYWMMKDLRRFPSNLVFYLSLCDCLFSLKYAVGSTIPHSVCLQYNEGACIFQTIWSQFWGLGSISWNAIISFNTLMSVINPFGDTAKYNVFYHAFVWLLAASTTATLIGFQGYGASGDGTCWIRVRNPESRPSYCAQGTSWTAPPEEKYLGLLFFVPLIAYFALGCITVLVAAFLTRRSRRSASGRGQQKLIYRMLLYVGVFILCWGGVAAHKLYLYFNETDNTFLRYLDAIGVSIQGFANAMIWLTNPKFFMAFKATILRKYFPCLLDSDDKIPLLPGQDDLEDENQNIQELNLQLRVNVLTTLLLAMGQSIGVHSKRESNSSISSEQHDQDFKEVYHLKRLSTKLLTGSQIEGYDELEFTFKDYAPRVFQRLRKLGGIDENDYIESLSPNHFLKHALKNSKFSEGRSGSFFVFSPDKRFIIKTIPENEAKVLTTILPQYYTYMAENPDSLIVKFFGLHTMRIPPGNTLCIVVMSNSFFSPGLHNDEVYDLKGSWINRGGMKKDKQQKQTGGVFKDVDFTDRGRQINITMQKKKKVLEILCKDSMFLEKLNIMDYSLLVGFHFLVEDDKSQQLEETIVQNSIAKNSNINSVLLSQDSTTIYSIGIIDILQAWDFPKKSEKFFKVYFLQKDQYGLSCQPPDYYGSRWRAFICQIFASENQNTVNNNHNSVDDTLIFKE